MRIGINDHIDGTQRTASGATAAADPVAAARAAGARAWAGTDERLERLRSRLDQPRRVLVRDFIIFELKLLLDQVKGLLIAQVAVVAFIIDMVRPRGHNFKAFYRVMDVGERMDMWLSLYGASRHAGEDPEGLMGESREGSPTMLGQLEHIVHRVVVGEQAEGELYPRSRATGATGAGSGSGQLPEAGETTGAGRPPQRPQAQEQAQAGTTPSMGAPARRSSFEAENYGQRGDR